MGFDERGNPLAEHWADECPADDAVDLVVAGRQRVANVVEESGQLELTVLGMRATQVRRTLQPVMQEGEAADVFVVRLLLQRGDDVVATIRAGSHTHALDQLDELEPLAVRTAEVER